MGALATLLAVVLRYGLLRRMTPEQIGTAQSMAWYYQANYSGEPLPDSHWAQLAVRAVFNGRDLPGCATSTHDALNVAWQGAAMGELRDSEPAPDVLAEHRELLERVLAGLSEIKRQVMDLRLAGVPGLAIAEELGITPGRVSQISREIAERFRHHG